MNFSKNQLFDSIQYDGADGHYSVVEKFLPPGSRGNILITSTNFGLKRLASSKNSMEVLEMRDEEVISLLLKSAMLDNTSDHISYLVRQLVSQLGGIPLAIDQAGAYMHSCSCQLVGLRVIWNCTQNTIIC